MVAMRPDVPVEKILRKLREQARALWGEERAGSISGSIEQTAQQLWEISRSLPHREVEPGFYQ
jgi:hypothetical protein